MNLKSKKLKVESYKDKYKYLALCYIRPDNSKIEGCFHFYVDKENTVEQ